jgi:hypothetical protein
MNIYSTPASEILDSACNLSDGKAFFVHIEGDDYYEFEKDNGVFTIYDPEHLPVEITRDSAILLEAIQILKTFT